MSESEWQEITDADLNHEIAQLLVIDLKDAIANRSAGHCMQIQDLPEAGLNYRSYCHGIISTAENREIKRTIGQLSARDMHTLSKLMRDILSI